MQSSDFPGETLRKLMGLGEVSLHKKEFGIFLMPLDSFLWQEVVTAHGISKLLLKALH